MSPASAALKKSSPGLFGAAVQLPLDVAFECGALRLAIVAVAEDMNPPTDPLARFLLRHAQQIGQ